MRAMPIMLLGPASPSRQLVTKIVTSDPDTRAFCHIGSPALGPVLSAGNFAAARRLSDP